MRGLLGANGMKGNPGLFGFSAFPRFLFCFYFHFSVEPRGIGFQLLFGFGILLVEILFAASGEQ